MRHSSWAELPTSDPINWWLIHSVGGTETKQFNIKSEKFNVIILLKNKRDPMNGSKILKTVENVYPKF